MFKWFTDLFRKQEEVLPPAPAEAFKRIIAERKKLNNVMRDAPTPNAATLKAIEDSYAGRVEPLYRNSAPHASAPRSASPVRPAPRRTSTSSTYHRNDDYSLLTPVVVHDTYTTPSGVDTWSGGGGSSGGGGGASSSWSDSGSCSSSDSSSSSSDSGSCGGD